MTIHRLSFIRILQLARLWVTCGLLFSSLTVYANNLCTDLFLKNHPQEASLLVSQLQQTFSKFNFNETKVITDANLHILDSAYDASTDTAFVGLKLDSDHTEFATSVAVHEIFHSIFAKSIHFVFENKKDTLSSHVITKAKQQQEQTAAWKNSPLYNNLLQQLDEATALRFKMMRERNPNWTEQLKVEKELTAKIKEFEKIVEADIQKQAAQLHKYDDLLKPYNELFADLASALFHNNPKIMLEHLPEKAITYTTNSNATRSRDFSQTPSFKNWKTEPKQTEYKFLDPVRGGIWKYIKNKFRSDVSQSEILQVYLLATDQHFQMLLKTGETDLTKINQQFLSLFVENAKLMGLFK